MWCSVSFMASSSDTVDSERTEQRAPPFGFAGPLSRARGGQNVKTRETMGKPNLRCRRSCSEQRPQLGHNLGHDGRRCLAGGLGTPGAPIEAAQLIDEDHARDTADASKRDLERVTLDPSRDGADEG